MTENQISICNNELLKLKTFCVENNHKYTPISVFYVKSGDQLKKVADVQCIKHNTKFSQIVADIYKLRKSKKCPKCFSEIQTVNIRRSVEKLNERIEKSKNPIIRNYQRAIEYLEKPSNGNSVVKVRCNVFGHHKAPFTQSAVSVGKNNVCPKCISYKPRLQGKDIFDKVEKILKESGSLLFFNQEIERNERGIIHYRLICHNCKNSEWVSEINIKSAKCGICYKKRSKGELLIQNYLLEKSISFEINKTFNDLRNILPLYFDFYLPKYNLVIEFDGHYHYQNNRKYLLRDKIKNNYCKINQINILRIPHWKIDIVPEIITNALEAIERNEKVFKISYFPKLLIRRMIFKSKFRF